MDRLDAMSLLVAVVETGSFSAASRKLDVPLATVSRKVADLEDHLKTRLLVRTTRKLSLTDAGAAYVATSKRILEQVGDAERAVAGEFTTPRGDLTVTAPLLLGRWHVLPVIHEFLGRFPEIKVRMILSDRNVHLIDDQIDMAVRVGPLPDSAMVATRIGSFNHVVCASPGFLAAHGTPKTPADLAVLPCVTFDALSSGADWVFASLDRKRAQVIRVNCRLAVNTAEAAIDAAVAGVGATRILSYQAARAVKDGKLKPMLKSFEREALPVSLIHAGQGLLPLKMRSFLEFATPRLRKALAGSGGR